MNELRQLYRDTILQHARDPVGFGRHVATTHRCEGHNPQCGDRVEILLEIKDGTIRDIGFEGEACSICIASASLMCEAVAGEPVVRLGRLSGSLADALAGGDDTGELEALSALLGVRPYPSRVQCAMLPWTTAQRALEDATSEP